MATGVASPPELRSEWEPQRYIIIGAGLYVLVGKVTGAVDLHTSVAFGLALARVRVHLRRIRNALPQERYRA